MSHWSCGFTHLSRIADCAAEGRRHLYRRETTNSIKKSGPQPGRIPECARDTAMDRLRQELADRTMSDARRFPP